MRDATSEAVDDAFIRAGMDLTDPLELQKDLAFLRDARRARERVGLKALLTGVGVIITTGAGFMAAGFVQWINSGGQ